MICPGRERKLGESEEQAEEIQDSHNVSTDKSLDLLDTFESFAGSHKETEECFPPSCRDDESTQFSITSEECDSDLQSLSSTSQEDIWDVYESDSELDDNGSTSKSTSSLLQYVINTVSFSLYFFT